MQTPLQIDTNIEQLLAQINTHEIPVYLEFEPEMYSDPSQSFKNVETKVEKDGGELVAGWLLWYGSLYVEAEYHAIWKSADNSLHNITPKLMPVDMEPIDKVLFVPLKGQDNKQCPQDNIRINITDNKLVDDLIAVSEAIFRLKQKYEGALQAGVELTEQETGLLEMLHILHYNILALLRDGGNRNSSCFCGEKKKFKHCHGKDLVEYLRML